jgi:hypothetical protein
VHKADMRGTIRNTVYPILFVLAPTEQGIIYQLGYQCLNRASLTILKRGWIFDNMCIDRHAGHIACLRTDYIDGLYYYLSLKITTRLSVVDSVSNVNIFSLKGTLEALTIILLCYAHISRTALKDKQRFFQNSDDREVAQSHIDRLHLSQSTPAFRSLAEKCMQHWRNVLKAPEAADWFEQYYLAHDLLWFIAATALAGVSTSKYTYALQTPFPFTSNRAKHLEICNVIHCLLTIDSNPIESLFRVFKRFGKNVPFGQFFLDTVPKILSYCADKCDQVSYISMTPNWFPHRDLILKAKNLLEAGTWKTRYN